MMRKRPLLLDLFSGAGGAAAGYYQAGFDVVGIDNRPQPRYPFPFIQGDALCPPVDLHRWTTGQEAPPTRKLVLDGRGAGHPVMFGKPTDAVAFEDFPDGGGFPRGFLRWLYREWAVDDPEQVLHVCSGSMRQGITVDIRHGTRPKIVADARRLPFKDESFGWVMCDPPYSEDWAVNLYGNARRQYPQPGMFMPELARVAASGGLIGVLHFIVPRPPIRCRLERVLGITQGVGYSIRALSIFRKDHEQMEIYVEP